jgi:hypothetical protein
MQTNIIEFAGVVLIGSAAAAYADVVAVDCVDDKVVISMAENIAAQAQERAGSEECLVPERDGLVEN